MFYHYSGHVSHIIRNRRSALLSVCLARMVFMQRQRMKTCRCGLALSNLKYENFTSPSGRLRQRLHQKAYHTCSTITFPHSTNQIIDLWRCRDRCCRHFLNCLFTTTTTCTSNFARVCFVRSFLAHRNWRLIEFIDSN